MLPVCSIPSMKAKMNELEARKASLTQKLEEAKLQAETYTPTPEMIRRYLEKDSDIRNKSLEEQKRIIQTYVSKVIVHENKIDIYAIVDLNGGGEATPRHIQQPTPWYIQSFKASRSEIYLRECKYIKTDTITKEEADKVSTS